MYLNLTDEQQFLAEAAADALSRHADLEKVREALDGAPPPDFWALAVEAGWTGLLSAEEVDGAGLGLYEALLVMEACGRRLVDARLLGHLAAVAILEASGADDCLRRSLALGERRAALLDASLASRGSVLQARREGDELVLAGELRGALDVAGADVLVVATPEGVGVMEADSVSVTVDAVYDATRSLATVVLDGARAVALAEVPPTLGRDVQRALLAAESVGAADACLAMSRDYAVDRVAFGRAIGSYQAIKHKLVEMLRRIENGRSLLVAAGRAWEDDRRGFALAANAARTVAGDALDHTAPETIFVHGGVGATWEHDASLYYRRAELSRKLAGGADAAAEAVAVALLGESGDRELSGTTSAR